MYKMCDRCRFSVPAKQPLCHVCGSHEFVADQLAATTPVEAGLQNCKNTLDGAMGKMQSAFVAIGKEITETAQKAQRATNSMRKLIFEAGPDHDQVLSFHRSIGSGRNVQFAPLLTTVHQGAKAVMTTEMPAVPGAVTDEPNSNLMNSKTSYASDDALFAPNQNFVDYMAAHSIATAQPDTLFVEPIVVDDFSAMFKTLLSNASSVTLDTESETIPKELDAESIRKNIGDLQGWFESYGKEGLLVKTELSMAATAPADDVVSPAAIQTETELKSVELELEHSRQAA